MRLRRLASPCLLLACLCLPLPAPALAGCLPSPMPPAALSQWKAGGFAVADDEREARALALVDCLGDPAPALRDGIAFEALSAWMRGGLLAPASLRALEARLTQQLAGADPAGFRRPFVALVLSEVARTDRVQPWMSAGERARMADAAAAYLRSVRDYRGYVDGEGWRHGVAHGADWALQLALNKAVAPSDVAALLSAVGAQAMAADGHAYAFGEPARLARAAAYAVARGDLAPGAVDAWLAGLAASLGPRPDGRAQADWWIRRANLEAFLHALGYLAAGDPSPALAGLAAGVREFLGKLP